MHLSDLKSHLMLVKTFSEIYRRFFLIVCFSPLVILVVLLVLVVYEYFLFVGFMGTDLL